MITNAPAPLADAADGKQKQKKRGHSRAASSPELLSPSRHSVPASSTTTTTTTTMEEQPRPPSKRNYPSGKKLSGGGGGGGGGKSRIRATARALVRGFSVMKMKRDSRGRGGYEAV
jgi:hypothetical protein